jgi:hypothetical protein
MNEGAPMADSKALCSHPMKSHERATLDMRLNDLMRFLGSPGDCGYGTEMGDLTIYLLLFRQKLQQSEK